MLVSHVLACAVLAAGTRTVTVSDTITETVTLPSPTQTATATRSSSETLTLPTATASSTASFTWTETLPTTTISLTFPTGTATFTETLTLPTATLTFSETMSTTMTLPTDTITFTLRTGTESMSESLTETFTLPTASDTFSLSNTDTTTLTLPTGTLTATGTFSSTYTMTLTLPSLSVSFTDTLTLTLPTATATATDTLSATASESLSISTTYSLTASESYTVTFTLPTATESFTASLTHSESASLSFTHSLSTTYSLTASESASLSFSETSSKTESLSQTESLSVTESLSLSHSDTLSLTHSLVRFDNYTTDLWPQRMIEGQEMRILLKPTADGAVGKFFNVTNNDIYANELEVRVYLYDSQLKYHCDEYVARGSGMPPLFRATQFGMSGVELLDGQEFASAAHTTFSAPHHTLPFLICFRHKPQEILFPHTDKWLLFTDDGGFKREGSAMVHHNYLFQAVPSGTWFEVNQPTTSQYAVLRLAKVEADWNFTLPGSACKKFPEDHASCADGDTLKIVPQGSPCTDSPVTLSSPLYVGSNLVRADGAWMQSAYSTMYSSAVAGGIGLFGYEKLHPLIETFNRTSTRLQYVHVYVRLPPSPGDYDICFSALEQRAAWKAQPANDTLSERPMWRKLWRCNNGCPQGAPRTHVWTPQMHIATLPTFRVDIEHLSWSIKDVTERSWGIIRVRGGGLSRVPSNSTDADYWEVNGGDQIRLIETSAVAARTGQPPDLGCWDWMSQQYYDEEAEYMSASRDLRAAPGNEMDDDQRDVSFTYATMYTGARYQRRFVCYRKAAAGSGWRQLPWDRSGEWSSLPPPLPGNHSYPLPEPLVAGPFYSPEPGPVVWAANDTRASTWGPLWVHEHNDTSRRPYVDPVARVVPWGKPCDYRRMYHWLEESQTDPAAGRQPPSFVVYPTDGVPPYEKPLYIQMPPLEGIYRVCYRSREWNWRASMYAMEVLPAPLVTVEFLDHRGDVDTIAMVNDPARQLSTLDVLKMVPFGENCLHPDVLSRAVVREYCESASRPLCGGAADTVLADTPSIFSRIAFHSAVRRYQAALAVYITAPTPTFYRVCFRQEFTDNWITGNYSWLGEAYRQPMVTPPAQGLRSGVVQEFKLEAYSRTANEFSARFVPCAHEAPCLQAPVGTEATRFGSSTVLYEDLTTELLFNITTPDTPGCYYLCYVLDYYTWHRAGLYDVFENKMRWSGAQDPYNTQTIELKITSLEFPLDAAKAPLGDVASLQAADTPCNMPAKVSDEDLGLGDGKVNTGTMIATLPATDGNVGVVYKVCLYTILPESPNARMWVEVPSEAGAVLTTLSVALSNWNLDPLLQDGSPNVSFSGLSTVYAVGSETQVGFKFSLHSPIVGGEVKLVMLSAQGCLSSAVPGISPVIVGISSAAFRMPFEAGKYLVCYKDVSGGGGWFAVQGPGVSPYLTVSSRSAPSFIKLNETYVMLSHLDAVGVAVTNTSCQNVQPQHWAPTVLRATWAAAQVRLPPLYPNALGRYVVCIQMRDGTRYHAWNKGNALEGGGSGFYQEGLAADSLAVDLNTNQFEAVGGRFALFDPELIPADLFTAPPPVSAESSFASYAHVSRDKRVRMTSTLTRLGSTVPYGTGNVWVVPCPPALTSGGLVCVDDDSAVRTADTLALPSPFLMTGGSCQKLDLGAVVFDVRIVSKCPGVFGCGFKIRAEMKNFVFTSLPVWVNVETHRPDGVQLKPVYDCLSGRPCNVSVQALWQGVSEVAPVGKVAITLSYNASNLTSGAIEGTGHREWDLGGVVGMNFVPVLAQGLSELRVAMTVAVDGVAGAWTSVVRIRDVYPATLSVVDLIPQDAWDTGLLRNRVPADTWMPRAGPFSNPNSYVEANMPYALLFHATDVDGIPITSLSGWNATVSLLVNGSAIGNSLLDPLQGSLVLYPLDLAQLSTTHGPLHPELWGGGAAVFQVPFRILNNIGCGRWDPCEVQVTLSPFLDTTVATLSGSVVISVRVPASTIQVVTSSTRVELGTGISVFATPGTPTAGGVFLVDEFHTGEIFAWMSAPRPIGPGGTARGGAALTSSSSGRALERVPGQGWGARWVLRATQPCVRCEATFHSTSGIGPDPGTNATAPSYGIVDFTFLSDATTVLCPERVTVPFYQFDSALFDVNVTAVNAFLRTAAWPSWAVVLETTAVPSHLTISGVTRTVMSEGVAVFRGLSFGGAPKDGDVVELVFLTTAPEYDTSQDGSIVNATQTKTCTVQLTLKKSLNPLLESLRLTLPNNTCSDELCVVEATTSSFLTLSFPFHVERAASAGWVRDGGDHNVTIGIESSVRPTLVDSWSCDQVTQTCLSTPLTLASTHPNVTLSDEGGVNRTLTYGSPTLRFSSRIKKQQHTDAGVLVRGGTGEITIVLEAAGVRVTPVREASFSICLLAAPSNIEARSTFHVLLACRKIHLTLTPHVAPAYAVQIFRAGATFPSALAVPGVGTECGPPATVLRFRTALTYTWSDVQFLDYGNATVFTVSTVIRQLLVDATDWSRSGLSLNFSQRAADGTTDVAFYGLAELESSVMMSALGLPGSTTSTKFVWKMSGAEGHSVQALSPQSDDACFQKATAFKLVDSYLTSTSNPWSGWHLPEGVVVGVAFPLQIRVVAQSGHRAYSHPSSLVQIALNAGRTCSGTGSLRVEVFDTETGQLVERNARTQYGQVTVFITLFEPCVDCSITATLCFVSATANTCLSSPSEEPPEVSRRTVTTEIFSTRATLPPVEAGVLSQRLPPLAHRTGTPITVEVTPVIALPGGWTATPPAALSAFQPLITSVWLDTSLNGLRYGNGGFLKAGPAICGIPEYPRYPLRFLPGDATPGSSRDSVTFSVSFSRPCSGCVLYVHYGEKAFPLLDGVAGALAVFRVETCSQHWLLRAPPMAVRRARPFSIALLRVDAGNVPTWTGDVETNATVSSREGNGYGGTVESESYSGEVTKSISGVATIRFMFSRACWACRIEAGFLSTAVTVTSDATSFVVTEFHPPSAAHVSTADSISLSYTGYLADDSGDKAVASGGPSVFFWQRPYQAAVLPPSYITLHPTRPVESSSIIQTSEGFVSLTVSDIGASTSLSAGFEVVDGSASGALLVTLTKGPVGNYVPEISFDGKPMRVVGPGGTAVPVADWLTPPSVMLIGEGAAISALSGERKSVTIRLAGRTDLSPTHYFTAVTKNEGGIFLEVTYDCTRCVNCVLDADTRVPLSERGVATVQFQLSYGGGACDMFVRTPGNSSLANVLAGRVELLIVQPIITNWYWVSSNDMIVSGGQRSAVEASVAAGTVHTLLLRGSSGGGKLVYAHTYTSVDADVIQVPLYPPECLRIHSKEAVGPYFRLNVTFAEGRCVLSAATDLPTGTKSDQVLEVTSQGVRSAVIVEHVGYKGQRYNVSNLDIPLSVAGHGTAVAARSGDRVELVVKTVSADGADVPGDFSSTVHWEVLQTYVDAGVVVQRWRNVSGTVQAGVARLSLVLQEDTRGVSCCAAANTSEACAYCRVDKTQPHIPWRMRVFVAAHDGSPLQDFDIGSLFVIGWPASTDVAVTTLGASTWHDLAGIHVLPRDTQHIDVLYGYPFTLRITYLTGADVKTVPTQDGEGPWGHLTLDPHTEPCTQSSWPGPLSCSTDAFEPGVCLYQRPGACGGFWLSDRPEGLRFAFAGGVAYLRSVRVVRAGRQQFSLLTEHGVAMYTGSVKVKSLEHFVMAGVGNCTLASVQERVHACELPAEVYDVTTPGQGAQAERQLRVDPLQPFDVVLQVIDKEGAVMTAIEGATMVLQIVCNFLPDNFTATAASTEVLSTSDTIVRFEEQVVEGVASFANVTMSGYCASTSLRILCGNALVPADLLNGIAIVFPSFEVGTPFTDTAAPVVTQAPTPQPTEPVDMIWFQIIASRIPVTLLTSVLRLALEADLFDRTGIIVELIPDWFCTVPLPEISDVPPLAGDQLNDTAPFITSAMKDNSAVCEAARGGSSAGRGIVGKSPCNASVPCGAASEFRMRTDLSAPFLADALLRIIHHNESNFRKLLLPEDGPVPRQLVALYADRSSHWYNVPYDAPDTLAPPMIEQAPRHAPASFVVVAAVLLLSVM